RVNSACAGPLGALLDLELDLLAADEAIEVKRGVEAAAMEEVFLRILSGDEAEAAVGDDLLDGSGGHMDLQRLPEQGLQNARPVRKGLTTRSIVARRGGSQSIAQMFDPAQPRSSDTPPTHTPH